MKKKTFLGLLIPLAVVGLASAGTLLISGTWYIFHPARNGGISYLLEVAVEETEYEAAGVEQAPAAELVVRLCGETIRQRLGAIGVAGPRVGVDQGSRRRLRVEIPAGKSLEAVPDLLENPGLLELKLAEGDPAPSREKLVQAFGGAVPSGLQVLCSAETAEPDQECFMVREEAEVTNRDIEWSTITSDANGNPAASFTLTKSAGEKFRQLTGANIGRRLVISLNGEALSAPTILDAIGREGIIHGNFTMNEASDLAVMLRAPPLAAPVRIIDSASIPGTSWLRPLATMALVSIAVLILSVAAMTAVVALRVKGRRASEDSSE